MVPACQMVNVVEKGVVSGLRVGVVDVGALKSSNGREHDVGEVGSGINWDCCQRQGLLGVGRSWFEFRVAQSASLEE